LNIFAILQKTLKHSLRISP